MNSPFANQCLMGQNGRRACTGLRSSSRNMKDLYLAVNFNATRQGNFGTHLISSSRRLMPAKEVHTHCQTSRRFRLPGYKWAGR